MTKRPSILTLLCDRQRGIGETREATVSCATRVHSKIDAEFLGLHGLVHKLRLAIDQPQWADIGRCLGSLESVLLDSDGVDQTTIPAKSRQLRDMFVALGGAKELFRILEQPLNPPDARAMSDASVKWRAEVFNQVMVMLRELLYSMPLLADKVTYTHHIVFLFTMLHHQCVCENSMNLLEEILASRSETFSIAEVPNLYALVAKFSTRQMAHFCRVLALLLFESEDRQIMESSKVLKSFELLNLRKERMTKPSFNIIELNQSLVLGMPKVLEHLVLILKILNYGPTVSEYVRSNISGHVPLSSDILAYLSGRDGNQEWDHFDRLHAIASSRRSVAAAPTSGNTARSVWGTGAPGGVVSAGAHLPTTSSMPNDNDIDDGTVLRDILNAFSANQPSANDSEAGDRYDPISSILRVLQVAHRIGIAPPGVENYDGVMEMLMNMSNPDAFPDAGRLAGGRNRRGVPPTGTDDTAFYSSYSSAAARHELQFYALVMAPHQIEVLFVICTLLCGRRKIQVQDTLRMLEFSEVLRLMNVRMSWDEPPFEGPNPYEHIHGPNCECNPESALRVQFLRLLHNFYDRDFMNNPLKEDMLSSADLEIISGIKKEMLMCRARAESMIFHSFDSTVVLPYSTSPIALPADTGLMGSIASTLMKEPKDSVYQFWLCSCIECYLRGQSEENQIYFARSGLLKHLVMHVIHHNTIKQTESVLQTSFDLIGELVKYNQVNIELLQKILCNSHGDSKYDENKSRAVSPAFATPLKNGTGQAALCKTDDVYGLENLISESVLGDSFCSFIKVVMDNIIDSNVLLRSLYLSMEEINAKNRRLMAQEKFLHAIRFTAVARDDDFGVVNSIGTPIDSAYLTHSWFQYTPSIGSKMEAVSAGCILKLPGYRDSTVTAARPNQSKISAIGSGILGAFRGVKESVMGFTPSNEYKNGTDNRLESGVNHEKSQSSKCSSSDDESVCVADVDPDCRRSSLTSSDNSFKTAADHDQEDLDTVTKELKETCIFSTPVDNEKVLVLTDPNAWLLPPQIQKLSSFLVAAKTRILLRLMSIVTLRSINHENICCMNTAVMILMFDHQRGILCETLVEVRDLAAKFGKCNCATSHPKSRLASNPIITGTGFSPVEQVDAVETLSSVPVTPSKEPNSHSVNSYFAQSRDGCMFCKPYNRLPTDEVIDTNGRSCTANACRKQCPVMINFRQLLWYWTEYYFRRGRDRLSLEFSSHIPFSSWWNIVGVLCADDNSSTSLVSEPLNLPESPYAPTIPLVQSVLKGHKFEEQRALKKPKFLSKFI